MEVKEEMACVEQVEQVSLGRWKGPRAPRIPSSANTQLLQRGNWTLAAAQPNQARLEDLRHPVLLGNMLNDDWSRKRLRMEHLWVHADKGSLWEGRNVCRAASGRLAPFRVFKQCSPGFFL